MHSSIGIMDIGSNSIRLVIYEIRDTGAYRIVREYKESARLSEKVGPDGRIERESVLGIAPLLRQFMEICEQNKVTRLRAGATAAIRNAINSEEVVAWIAEETGLQVEVLSGEEEGKAGFLGVVNTMNVRDGMIIDIGGGSTEVTLFRERKRLKTYSFPFGAVNTNLRFGKENKDGIWEAAQIARLEKFVQSALEEHPWITANSGLPFIGLGGTMRTLAKISQRTRDYSLQVTHHYEMEADEVDRMFAHLPRLSNGQRKKIAGLSKDRADIIIPGLIILQTIFRAAQGASFLISGAGLRDGLFHELVRPQEPVLPDPLESSLHNVLEFGIPADPEHLERVLNYTQQLYRLLAGESSLLDERVIRTAARLYKAGTILNYYHYTQHSVYWIMRAGLGGLSHREMVLAAIAADYHPKNRTERLLHAHKDILQTVDIQKVHRIGSLLQLGIALDRSETGLVDNMVPSFDDGSLHLRLHSREEPILELKAMEAAAKDVQKAWDIILSWSVYLSSNS
ncbi:Ppx/GppA family phosphatase [Paenibacillus sp. P96]|uniref:Chaperone protein DnaK n=1 Tax=Paenibacillus zeirhizosphaerae TaxID=2987519 RepID=A0ABT9FVE7_9BACL|nr:Ppx/GppA phosphatase family protein [Paenibacillus sp. P96]MDP4098442.1 Ppx/GppA family phosphatase [Paenibacillus sp. P96]